MGSLPPPNAETIRTWADAEEAALTALRAKIRELQAEEAVLITRVKALRDMLGTFSPAPVEAAPVPSTALAAPTNERAPREEPGKRSLKIAEGHRGSVGFRVRTQVAEVLAERHEPMHINDIWAEFQRRGWEVPGRGNAANITAHLTGSVEIVSPTRGYYILARRTGASSGTEATAPVRTSEARSASAKSSQGSR